MAIAGETRVLSAMVHLENGGLKVPGHLEQVPPRLCYSNRAGDKLGNLQDAADKIMMGIAVRVDFTGGQYLDLSRMVAERVKAK